MLSIFLNVHHFLRSHGTNQGGEKEDEEKKGEVAGKKRGVQEGWAGPEQGVGWATVGPVFTEAEQDAPDDSLAEGKR